MAPPNIIKFKVDILLLLNYFIYMDKIKVNEQVDFWLESSNKDLTWKNNEIERSWSIDLLNNYLDLLVENI